MPRLLRLLFATLALSGASAHATYPERPIRIVVGFPAGGPLDSHGRLLADKLQAQLGQPVLIDNKTGGSGATGAEFVARAPADGYTLLLANTGVLAVNPALRPRLGYSTLRDFTPVARTAQLPLTLLVNPNVAAGSIEALVALARQRPGGLSYGSAGSGGLSHLVPEMFKRATGTFIVHIPYRGSASALADLMSGQVQLMAESVPTALPLVRQGKLRALAVTGRERSSALPEVPTLTEVGIKGLDVVGFYGVMAPAGTPREVVARLGEAFRQVLDSHEVRSRMGTLGTDSAYLSGEQFGRYLAAELPVWARAVRDSGATLD